MDTRRPLDLNKQHSHSHHQLQQQSHQFPASSAAAGGQGYLSRNNCNGISARQTPAARSQPQLCGCRSAYFSPTSLNAEISSILFHSLTAEETPTPISTPRVSQHQFVRQPILGLSRNLPGASAVLSNQSQQKTPVANLPPSSGKPEVIPVFRPSTLTRFASIQVPEIPHIYQTHCVHYFVFKPRRLYVEVRRAALIDFPSIPAPSCLNV